MLDVNEYIKLILKKKKWTLQQFADSINKVKEKAGLDGKVTKQNISNFLNQTDDKHILRPKQLAIWEKALELPQGVLIKMVFPVVSKNGQKELKEIMEKVGEVK